MPTTLLRSGVSRAASFGAVVLLCSGCSTETSPTQDLSVRDSAGVEIVEYEGDFPSQTLAVEEIWEYGYGPSDYAFQYVQGGALLADGSAVIGDTGNGELVQVAADGTSHLLLARSGQGPTEVRSPRSVVRFGADSIWIEDVGNAKLMLLVEGVVEETFSTQGSFELTYGLMPQGTDQYGHLLMSTAAYRPDFETEWLDGHMTRFDPATEVLDTLESYAMAPRIDGETRSPFLPRGMVTSAGGLFVHARMDRPELFVRGADGSLVRIIRWRPQARYPSDELWERFVEALRADLTRVNPTMSGERLQNFLDRQVERYEVDPTEPLPIFGRLVGDATGAIWLGAYEPGTAGPRSYTVLSQDGRLLGRVDFPRSFQLLDAKRDQVLGSVVDDLGVHAVALYRLAFEG